MAKTLKLMYRVVSRAVHVCQVPDEFDAGNPTHVEKLQELLGDYDYDNENVVEENLTGVSVESNVSGGLDFTDLEV